LTFYKKTMRKLSF